MTAHSGANKKKNLEGNETTSDVFVTAQKHFCLRPWLQNNCFASVATGQEMQKGTNW